VSGKIFDMGLPDDVIETLLARAAGRRFRFPKIESKHNPIFVRNRKAAVCQEYMSGETKEQIAKRHHIVVRTVELYLKENNIQTKAETQKTRREQIREYLGKYSKAVIAKMLGISRQRLYQIMKEEGL